MAENKETKLDPAPARRNLTSRECSILVGACIGGLLEMAGENEVRDAVRVWAERDEAWTELREVRELALAAMQSIGPDG